MERELLDLIYSTVPDPTRWSDVLIGVSDHLGAVGGMLAYVPPPRSRKPVIQILGRLPEEPSALFASTMHGIRGPRQLRKCLLDRRSALTR
jgi:hypothetical protein